MTTETETIHFARLGQCCDRIATGSAATTMRNRVTCPACLTAMGEPAETESRHCEEWCGSGGAAGIHSGGEGPQCYASDGDTACRCSPECSETDARYWDTAIPEPVVVSGLDTAAAPAPTVKPAHVAIGQRWRFSAGFVAGIYTVTEGPNKGGEWKTDWDDGGPIWFLAGAILCDEYLGTVPAPVSAPRGLTAGEESALNAAKQYKGPSVGCGQSTPVETPPAWEHQDVDGAKCSCEVPGCNPFVSHAPAAPAPGVGEGPRELTFAEAMVLDPAAVEVEDEQGHWHSLAAMLDCTLGSLRQCKFRLKPGPLPAPAPRVSRVAQMVHDEAGTYEDKTFGIVSTEQAQSLCERVVEAALEAVRDEVRPLLGSGVDPALDRARVAMLEPRPADACPGRRP